MNEDQNPGRSRRSRLLGWGFAALLLGSLVLLFERLDLRQVLQLVSASHPGLLALAVLVNLTLNTYMRVRRRRVLLQAAAESAPDIGLWELTKLFFASYAANNLLPARAGDVLFAVELRRRGFRLASVVAAQLSEKLVELGSLWLLIPAALFLAPVPTRMQNGLSLLLIGGAVSFGLIIAFVRGGGHALPSRMSFEEAPRGTLRRLALRARRSLYVSLVSIRRIATPPVALRALLWSCGQDASDILMVGLVAMAVGIHVGPGGWLLVYLAVNLASALPSTPGQIGLIEAGAVFALVGLGVGPNHAMAFALLYHLAHLIPTTLLGLPLLLRLRGKHHGDALLAPSP
jgi:uncharacterized protein (TIRG00374 family)